MESDNKIEGMVNFKHYLNDFGGQIVYGIRPIERRKGYFKLYLSLLEVQTTEIDRLWWIALIQIRNLKKDFKH